MEAEYRSLTSLRGHITRGLNYMTDAPTSDAGVRYLELQSASLEKRWNSYESRWDIFVDKYIDESGHDEREARQIDLQDKYHEIQLKLSLYMKQFSPISQSNPHGSTNSMIKVKLPEIKLKEFSGDPLDWTRFWNQFSTSIHLKKDIDDVTKYVYLTQCIKGNAQKLLAGFKGEASDYGDAIKALTEMYGDPKKIRRTLLRSLINLGKPKYVRSEIFDFKVDLENLLMQIGHDSEIDVSSNEMILRELIVLKLPKEVEDFMFGLYKTMYFSVSQIKEGLQHLLNFMEHENKGSANKGTPEVNKIRFQSPAKPSSPFKGSSTVGTYTTLSNYSCIYCKGKHRPFDCTIYSSLNARRERLKVLNRCIKCTKVHQSTECATILNMCPHCRKGKHYSFLCISSPGSVGTPNIGKSTVTSKDINSDKLNGDPVTTNQVMSIINKQSSHQNYSVALPTAMVTVRSEDGQLISVRCLFDSGSQRSFIHKDLANKLSLRTVSTVNMILNSFDGMGDSRDYEIVNPVVSLGNRKKRVSLIVVKDMPEPIITPGLCDTMRYLDKIGYHLADRDIKSDKIDNIKMLIGADFLGNYLSDMRQVNNVDLLESPGGYLIYGLIPHRGMDHIHCNSALVAGVSVELGENAPLLVDPRTISSAVVDDTLPVHKLWDLDVVGIIPSQVSPSDVETISKYETTVLHRNGRYWGELPFKHNHPFLPTNYNVALGQMYNQLKRFQHQPDHLKCYDNIIKEQLKLGFIEEVENPVISPNTHYLPHHAVRKNSSTTPLRVVYNCSAKPSKSSASLNDCLMTGPSLTEKLFDVLVGFRMNKFACIADIEKAFLQIGLQQHHRDFTRFLWLEDPFDENSRVKTYRFKSVLFGATFSPFLLQMTLQYHFQISHSPYSGVLLSSFYVDNFQHNADNEQQLVELYDVANVEMKVIIWSDSEVALQWLKNNKCKITSIQNRVAQIKEIGSSFNVLYVSTKENPADLLTRGISITQFHDFVLSISAPVTVISENGSNFLASAKFFDQLLMQRDVKEYMAVNNIQWRFIAPRAPWQGGFYERLIGLTKSCLNKVLFKKRVNADELETVLKEIQCKLNNRPLTYIDAETPIEPLAPIHLWCGRIINPMPSVVLDSQEDPNFLVHSEFNKRYSQVSVILNHFENMWRNEYLTALREKHYGGSQACQDKAPLVGDVVIVERPGPQHEWPLGRIVKLYPDKENIIRVVDVLYNGSISKRTIDKLVPLEIHSPLINSTIAQGEESQPNVSGETKQIHGDSVSEVRPLRKAALKAAKLRQYLIDNDQI
ncbi:uncharacterized protein [Palaemon carinicauda]|uniref:uncharacterized protein n=1 Tax=Palaemon carinicauda TaxID=392227 RepID=UPI0035B6070F